MNVRTVGVDGFESVDGNRLLDGLVQLSIIRRGFIAQGSV